MIDLRGRQFWLYRGGLELAAPNFMHAICSHTCICFEPENSYNDTIEGIYPLVAILRNPFELPYTSPWSNWPALLDRIWPKPIWCHTRVPLIGDPRREWNSAAPEGAFRLQRVGVNAGHTAIGRIMLPIVRDDWYVDRPHRRRVDGPWWTSKLSRNVILMYPEWTFNGRRYICCVFHRREWAYTPVQTYRVPSSVGRVWQRNRTYQPWRHHDNDMTFIPDELDA